MSFITVLMYYSTLWKLPTYGIHIFHGVIRIKSTEFGSDGKNRKKALCLCKAFFLRNLPPAV